MSIQLIQGDCLDKMSNIVDGSIDLVLADPPYGTTACKWDTIIPFEPMWKELKRITKKNGAIILFGSQPFTSALVMSNPKMYRYCWYWEKDYGVGFMNAKKMPLKKIEDVCVFYKKLPTYNPQGLLSFNKKITMKKRTSDSVFGNMGVNKNHNKEYVQEFTNYPHNLLRFKTAKALHPTQKPVAIMEYIIKTYTNEEDIVLDFTMGSGTTGVACVNLNRKFIGIELNQEYFKCAENRILGGIKL